MIALLYLNSYFDAYCINYVQGRYGVSSAIGRYCGLSWSIDHSGVSIPRQIVS